MPLDPMKSKQPTNAFVDGMADSRGVGIGRKTSELGNAIERVCGHRGRTAEVKLNDHPRAPIPASHDNV